MDRKASKEMLAFLEPLAGRGCPAFPAEWVKRANLLTFHPRKRPGTKDSPVWWDSEETGEIKDGQESRVCKEIRLLRTRRRGGESGEIRATQGFKASEEIKGNKALPEMKVHQKLN